MPMGHIKSSVLSGLSCIVWPIEEKNCTLDWLELKGHDTVVESVAASLHCLHVCVHRHHARPLYKAPLVLKLGVASRYAVVCRMNLSKLMTAVCRQYGVQLRYAAVTPFRRSRLASQILHGTRSAAASETGKCEFGNRGFGSKKAADFGQGELGLRDLGHAAAT